MIAEILQYFVLLSLVATVLILLPGVVRARAWIGVPLGVAAAGIAGVGLYLLSGDLSAAEFLSAWAVLFGVVARLLLDQWSYMASLLLSAVVFAGAAYLVYSVLAAIVDPLGPVVWVGSVVLLILEVVALGLAVSYAYEVLDVLSRRRPTLHVTPRTPASGGRWRRSASDSDPASSSSTWRTGRASRQARSTRRRGACRPRSR